MLRWNLHSGKMHAYRYHIVKINILLLKLYSQLAMRVYGDCVDGAGVRGLRREVRGPSGEGSSLCGSKASHWAALTIDTMHTGTFLT